jgi:hypothetical protein
MSITNKAISTTFFNIIIRTYHGQTEIVIQYGCLRSSVMCVNTSCSNDSFASPTHTTKQSLDKAFCDVVPIVHNASRSACSVSRGLWGWWTRLLSSSYKCAIVDWSGDNVDQRRKRVWFWFRKSWQTRATWHRGLPCWKTWSEKSLKIPKGQSESVYRRRKDNRKSTKGQTTIYKT